MKAVRINSLTEQNMSTSKIGRKEERKGQISNGAIFAGNIDGMMTDRAESKRLQARKQVAKMMRDQFASDQKITDRLNEMRDGLEELREKKNSLVNNSRYRNDGIEEMRRLQETYGVLDDSREQKDLELIRKAYAAIKDGTLDGLNEEEIEKLAEMGPLTEYQREALALDRAVSAFNESVSQLDNAIESGVRALAQVNIDLAKNTGMIKVTKAVEELLKITSDSIINMLRTEAKSHLDEDMQELVDAAKEAAKKKKEEQERLQEVKDEKKEQEELVEEISKNALDQKELQQQIDKILRDAELLGEDIKGLMVDGQL